MTRIISIVLAAVAAGFMASAAAAADVKSLFTPEVFKALAMQESGGEKNPDQAVGDNGRSLGRYQIQKGYWTDACRQNPSLAKRGFEAVKDPRYAEEVIIAYAELYAPKGATLEDVIRNHNGGPKGYCRTGTLRYWGEVSHKIEKIKKKKGVKQ